MAQGFWLESEGFPRADRHLQRLGLFLNDLRPFWPLLVPLFTGWMREQFASEGEFAGSRWAELSPEYGIWKQQHYPGKPILQASGALRRAASNPGRRATARTLTLTIHDPKLQYHQEGTDKMPARPLVFTELPPQAQRQLQQVAGRYVEELLARL